MHQNQQLAPLNFGVFSFLLVQVFSVAMNGGGKKKSTEEMWACFCRLFYFFSLAYKISFFKELSLQSAVLKFSFLVENLHTVMQYSSPGKIFMAYVNEIRPAPGGIDRMLRRKLTVY